MIKLQTFVLLVSGLSAVAQTPGTFVFTGSMATARIEGHTATLLRDGRVLITGGSDGQASLASTELYDPSTGTFTVSGAMVTPRSLHTATLLNDGRVLVAGGSHGRLPSAELYDPSTGSFTPTGNMVNADQYEHSATLLSNGKVLISAGVFGMSPVLPARPELYDPVTGTFTHAGEAKLTVGGATSTLLTNGQVLLAGGYRVGDASLYDPANGSLKFLIYLSIWGHTATLLKNGTVLIAAGSVYSDRNDYAQEPTGAAQIYDPSRGRFKETGFRQTGSLSEPRTYHSATLLPGGQVLVAGGADVSQDLASAELYDPATRSFTHTGAMNMSHFAHTATLLGDGRVLIIGGPNTSAELYIPPVRAASAASLTGPLAPASLASLFGSRFALTTKTADPLSPPTSLGGIGLRVVDSLGVARLAPLLYVSPSQINFEVPAGTATGKITLEVVNAPTPASAVAAQVENIAPSLFALEYNTAAAYALRLELDGKQTVLSVRSTVVLDDRPVYLVLYATGIRNRSSVASMQCTIGGINVPVEYAGPEGSGTPGLDQVNVRLTSDLNGVGAANLVLTVDGIPSNTVSVDIR